MNLYLSHEFLSFEAGNILRLFFPYEQHRIITENEREANAWLLIGDDISFKFIFDGDEHGDKQRASGKEDKQELEYIATSLMFKCFKKATGYNPSWGMLTGIHPVKLFVKKTKELGEAGAAKLFSENFFVSNEKIKLCIEIATQQKRALDSLKPMDFSLYISIPFCPSRCSYCSFVSHSVEKSQKLIEPYLELLLKELEFTAEIVRETGLNLTCVYIGGGTPTTLSAPQMSRLIKGVREYFDLSSCTEFTVEAGRPDTIDENKLSVLKSLCVGRISINPQTLEDSVLQTIGRNHSASDVYEAYGLAEKYGFDINMDLIAGLQGDTAETFTSTVDKVIALNPENVTVHCLALKRSANIFRSQDMESYHSDKEKVENMVNYAFSSLTSAGYKPYYLYRQSRMAGNLENIGFAKEGKVCDYNVYTMDESQTVIACGAGGVSKIVDPYSDRLERIFNFKYSYEYTDRFSEILNRKKEVTKLYAQFRQRLH